MDEWDENRGSSGLLSKTSGILQNALDDPKLN